MREITTKQATPEQVKELVSQIINSGDDEAAGALAALVSALAGVSDEDARQELAATVAETAYGNALLAFTRGTASQSYVEPSR